jgi:ribokinase
MARGQITVMGSFVADVAFRMKELPAWGETLFGSEFRLGPGGKGSNQAIAAARAGGRVSFISKVGRDTFGDLARSTHREEGIDTRFLFETTEHSTGAAAILIDEAKGENAIIVVPGACYHLTSGEIDAARELIAQSAIFLSQLEVSVQAVERGLHLAHDAGVPVILNPAPVAPLPEYAYALCDYLTPNESEAAALTGLPVTNLVEAEDAAAALLARGVGNVILTLGAQGALIKNSQITRHVPAVEAGPVLETTGAGDAFNGGLAVALAEGLDIVSATRFGCAVAGLSVTRHGTAPSMPKRPEVDALLERVGR